MATIILAICVIILVIICIGLTGVVLCQYTVKEMLIEQLRHKEEIMCRQRELVYTKFNYNLPFSDKYLALEELKHEKGGSNND